MGRLAAAVSRLTARKAAALVPDAPEMGTRETLMLLSGFDVEVSELRLFSENAATQAIEAIAAGADPRVAIAGVWVDGLGTGLLHDR